MKKLLAEGFGTFWLVLGGCGSAVLAAGIPQFGIGYAGVALAFGLTVLTMAYAIGHISGCHLNPAVSFGLATAGRFQWSKLPGYVAAQVLGGVAGAFSNAIAMFTILSRWFTRKWGTAIGIAMAGGGIGSIAIQPLVGILAQNYGWQATYIFAGSLVLAVNVPLILFVLKDRPESMGLLSDGDEPGQTAVPESGNLPVKSTVKLQNTGPDNERFTYLKNPSLWLMGISFAFVSIGSSAITTQEVSFLTDMHVSDTIAATARGLTLGIGAIAALSSGWLADRLISRYVTILFFFLSMVGMLILIPAVSMSQIWPFVIIYGLGIGAGGTLLPIVTRDISAPVTSARCSDLLSYCCPPVILLVPRWPDLCMTLPGLTTLCLSSLPLSILHR